MLLQDQQKSSNKDPKQSSLIKKAQSQEENKQQDTNSLLQYNIQKLLAQSAARQQKYINFIKQQKQKLFEVTQKYADVMLQYKKQIKQFISKKQIQKNAKRFEKVHTLTTKVPPNKYEKKQYTIQSQYQLYCKIKFSYIIPIVEDYYKQIFPHKFYIQFTQYYPNRQHKTFQVQLNPQIDQQQRIQRMKNKYSIQMYSPNMNQIVHSFVISHFHDRVDGEKILRYYRENQLQFMLRDKQSQLLFGYGKIDLQQLLQFSQNQQTFLQKIPVISTQSPDTIIAFIHIQMTNTPTPKSAPKHHTHKISQPISITTNRPQLKFHNDKQTRIIQRINQYKNTHHNAIPSTSRDMMQRNLLMHRKRKQLERIESYKEMHKEEYMEKIFGQAIQQYHTQYIPFVYTNHTQRHQKIKIKLSHKQLKQPNPNLNNNNNNNNNNNKIQPLKTQQQSISLQIVDSTLISRLIKQQIISYSHQLQNCNIQYALQDDYVFVINGQSIVIYVKVICHTLHSIHNKYQISIDLNNDFGEALHNDMIILKTYLPVPTHIFPIYTYIGQHYEVKIQTPHAYTHSNGSSVSVVGKSKIANIIGNNQYIQLQSNWSYGYEILQLKITPLSKLHSNKQYQFYILIYDINYIVKLATYEFILQAIAMTEIQPIQLGITNTFNLKLKLPPVQQQQQQQQTSITSTIPSSKVMVRLASSDFFNGCCKVRGSVSNSRQFVMQRNIQYPIIINYNTFTSTPSTSRLIITCTDTTTEKSLQKVLLPLRKTPTQHKRLYQLTTPRTKPLPFNFELNCQHKQQTTYKLYSSNHTLMTIDEDTVVLFPSQVRVVKLHFRYWDSQGDGGDGSGGRSVVLAVDDGSNVGLYLFQLHPDDNA